MVESQTKRVGKFTVLEEAEGPSSEVLAAAASTKEGQQESAQDSVDSFTLKTTQTKRRGRQAAKPKPVIQEVAEAPANYSLWSQLLIGSTNTVVVTWLGPECAMERREAEMLEPPIARILARMPVSQSQKMATFIDPMVILIAMGTWGNRIVRIQRAKRPNLVSQEEMARASGVASPPPQEPVYQEPTPEPVYYERPKVAVNPNGIPTAITSQMGEV